jgi:hypothetical protein
MAFAKKLRENVLVVKDNELSKIETWYQRWSNKNLESMKTRCVVASKVGAISTVYEIRTEVLDEKFSDGSLDYKFTIKKCHLYSERVKIVLTELGLKTSIEVIFEFEKISPMEERPVSFFIFTMVWN